MGGEGICIEKRENRFADMESCRSAGGARARFAIASREVAANSYGRTTFTRKKRLAELVVSQSSAMAGFPSTT